MLMSSGRNRQLYAVHLCWPAEQHCVQAAVPRSNCCITWYPEHLLQHMLQKSILPHSCGSAVSRYIACMHIMMSSSKPPSMPHIPFRSIQQCCILIIIPQAHNGVLKRPAQHATSESLAFRSSLHCCILIIACRHIMMSSSNPPSMPQIARLLSAAYPGAKVPPLTAPEWSVMYLAKFKSAKLGFDLPKFK